MAVERASETSMCLYGTGFPKAFFKRLLKTNFSKRFFPQLKNYITSITKVPYFIPESAFKAGPRCSELRIDLKPQKTTKHNNAPRMAELALTLAKTNRERHQAVENFFLANDSTTVAIEVPVYIKPEELTKTEQKEYGINLDEPLSGHIDILIKFISLTINPMPKSQIKQPQINFSCTPWH